MLDYFRISSDFRYERNIVLGDHLRKKGDSFPWHASKTTSLDLELFVPPLQMTQFSEAFAVHPPNELPMMQAINSEIFEFSGKRHIEVLITPNVIRSDERLNKLDPSERSCYFEGEKMLQFFKVYTKHNCDIECYTKYINASVLCSCVYFDIARGPDARVCGQGEYFCEIKELRQVKPTENLAPCNCLQPCNLVSYSIDITESKLHRNE